MLSKINKLTTHHYKNYQALFFSAPFNTTIFKETYFIRFFLMVVFLFFEHMEVIVKGEN